MTELEKLHEVLWDADGFLINGIPAQHYYAADPEEVDIEEEEDGSVVALELYYWEDHQLYEFEFDLDDLADAEILQSSIKMGKDVVTPLFGINLTEL